MNRKKGYTLAEILTTVVILAVIAGIAVPNFEKSRAKAELDQAVANLRTIRTAQRMYFARNGDYLCQTAADCNDADKIKTVLGAEVKMASYAFSVTATATTFTATATGASTITLNQDCGWTGVSPSPGC